MAIIRPIKVDATTGLFIEMDNSADDLRANTIALEGSMVVLNSGGIVLNSGTISGAGDISFIAPSTKGLVQTSGGTLAADNIMGKDRDNTLNSNATILFPTIDNTPSGLIAFRLPNVTVAPTATPAVAGIGYLVAQSGTLWLWDGVAWVNGATAQTVAKSYIAATGVGAGHPVCLNSACMVVHALNLTESAARCIGFALNSAGSGVSVSVVRHGSIAIGTALVPGSRYFLGSASGVITATPAASANHQIVQVGYAEGTGSLAIQIIPLAIRRT